MRLRAVKPVYNSPSDVWTMFTYIGDIEEDIPYMAMYIHYRYYKRVAINTYSLLFCWKRELLQSAEVVTPCDLELDILRYCMQKKNPLK